MPDRAEPEIEAVERLLRLRHAFAREFERLAVMAAEQRQADRLARPFGQELVYGNEIAERLRHLLACRRGEEAVMQPVAGERRAAMRTDALGDLVLMVRKDEVEPAAMDVEGLAEMRLGHRRAFDVPAGPAAPTPLALPGAVPPRQRRRRRLPQDEVASVALIGCDLDARALALLVEVLA